MMSARRSLGSRCVALAFTCIALGTTPSAGVAQPAAGSWAVEGKLFGKPKDGGEPDHKVAADVSGLACEPGPAARRLCVLVDDESQGAQVVILEQGRLTAGSFIRLITDSHDGKALELDAEAVAFSRGAFYVMGSHGRPRHEAEPDKEAKNLARAKASRRLFRIQFAPGAIDMTTGNLKAGETAKITESRALTRLIADEPALAGLGQTALADNGLTIEGLALSGDLMLVGFRGPVLASGEAVVLAAPLETIFPDKPLKAELKRLALGADSRGKARGVRDLTPLGADVLVLAGPMLDPPDDRVAPGDYTLFLWRGDEVRKLVDLESQGDAIKPEALTVIDQQGEKARLLLLFDGPVNGAPRALMVDPPKPGQAAPAEPEATP